MTDPQDPAELLEELGVERPADVDLDADAQAALAALRQKVQADMSATQGPWRTSSMLKRYWPMGVALLAGLAFVFAMPHQQLNGVLSAAIIFAALTAMVCFCAVLMAPTHPARSERVAVGGIALAVISFGLQIYGGSLQGGESFHLGMALQCSSKLALGSAIPLALLVYGLRRTGFPVRALHAMALTAASLSLAGVGIWWACAPDEPLHFTLSHVAVPVILIPLAGLLVWKLARAKSTMV
jgi:hypothetical protein